MDLASQDEEVKKNILEAKMDNAKNMATLLRAIHFKDTAMVFASEKGLKVTVDDSKCILANAYIQSDLFRHYSIAQDEEITFRINLNILLECLNIFGSTSNYQCGGCTAFELCYMGYGEPLVLLLEECGAVTNCSIKTLETDDMLDFNFDNDDIVNKVIIKSECLKEAFFEFDPTSEVLEITISSDRPYFRLTTHGYSGAYHWDFSKDSDMIEQFTCNKDQKNKYKMSLIKHTIKALVASTWTSIRMDSKGFLSVQFMIKLEDGQTSFAEFFCIPDLEDSLED